MPQHALIFIAAHAHLTGDAGQNALQLSATDDAAALPLNGVHAVHLWFARFTDGRAYSQAVQLRQRGFAGPIVARGDVLADQALMLARCGFSHAQLRADQSLAVAQRQLSHFAALPGWYQADTAGASAQPHNTSLATSRAPSPAAEIAI